MEMPAVSSASICRTYGTQEKYFTALDLRAFVATESDEIMFLGVIGSEPEGNSQMSAFDVQARKQSAIPP